MPRVTGLQERRPGRTHVELDGRKWRVMPTEVALRVGLCEGLELDRERLRTLRRELLRAAALQSAGRALRMRDLTRTEVGSRLTRAGIPPIDSAETLAVLERVGWVDDERVAFAQARSLADRGYGDEAIRFRLGRAGVATELVESAIAALDPEPGRSQAIVDARGPGIATARFLARRGFNEDVVASAVGTDVADDGPAAVR